MRRDDGGYCGELMMGTDCIRCTVQLWFTSIPPLLLAVEGMSLLEDTKRQAANYGTTSAGDSQLVLAVSMAVVLFCIHGLRVVWPKSFEGELLQHGIDCRSRGWRMLIS